MPVPSYGRSPREQSKRESRKNLKGLVRDNLHACTGLSTCNIDSNGSKFDSKTDPSCGNCSNGDLWVTHEDKCIKSNDWPVNVGDSSNQSAALRRRQSRILDRWAARQAREMITTIERRACEAELQALSSAHPVSTLASSFMREPSPARSECSIELPNLRASSLVQMWRELESEAMSVENRTSSVNSPGSATSNAVSSIADNGSFNEEHPEYESDDRNESPVAPDDSCMDWESDAVAPRVSGSGETERGRVSDIVRRLNSGYRTTSSLTSGSDENEREQLTPSPLGVQGQTMFDLRGRSSEFHLNGNRQLIRGRQATRDLFTRIGRDRERELARLVERHTVSYFSHRSRIQALLRFRLLQHEVAIQERPNPTSAASELDELQQRTSISLLRQRFCPRSEPDSCSPLFSNASSRRQLPINLLDSEHSGVSEQLSNENIDDQETPTGEHDQESLTSFSLPSTSGYWPESCQRPDNVWNENRLSVHDHLHLQETMATSSHGVTEERDSDANQHVEAERIDVRQSMDDSCPHRPRGGRSEAMHQVEQACQTSHFAWHKRRLSIHDIDWYRNISAVTIESDANTQQHVEVVAHSGGNLSAEACDLPRGGNSEAICQNWLESISNNEDGYAVTIETDPDTQQLEGEQHTDATWSTQDSNLQRIGNGHDEAMYQDWPESISNNEEGDVVTAELEPNTRHHVGLGIIQGARVVHDEAMYQDWLERISDNEEMLALLARSVVSTTLASDFRTRMDRLMSSHLQIQENQFFMEDSIVREEDSSPQLPLPSRFSDHQDSHNANLVASPSTQLPLPSQFSDHQDSSLWNSSFTYNEEQNFPQLLNVDEHSHVNEVALTSIQLPLPSRLLHQQVGQLQSSPQLHDDEASNVNQLASASIQMPLQSQLLDRQSSSPQQNSSQPSMDTELIYDLREDMLRLHEDMCELRRSIESCINMQVMLQRSIKQEVSAASSNSAAESDKRSKSSEWALTRKGSCCICCEMQIDSLLYRCGHMCTCYKCAYELQWSCGICPICRAPIVDVVRAYSDT